MSSVPCFPFTGMAKFVPRWLLKSARWLLKSARWLLKSARWLLKGVSKAPVSSFRCARLSSLRTAYTY